MVLLVVKIDEVSRIRNNIVTLLDKYAWLLVVAGV